jgi:hypothetical protein
MGTPKTDSELIKELIELLNSPKNIQIILENQKFSEEIKEFVEKNIVVKGEGLKQPFTI